MNPMLKDISRISGVIMYLSLGITVLLIIIAAVTSVTFHILSFALSSVMLCALAVNGITDYLLAKELDRYDDEIQTK